MISVILTCRNEKEIIENSIKKLYDYLRENFDEFEILILDDASTDGTQEILKEIAKKYKNVRIFLREKRLGKGWSIMYLIRKAKYDKIIFIDSDLSTNLENIKKFFDELDNYDVVIGIRKKRENFVRWFLSKVYNFLANILLFLDISDLQTGFKAFRKSKVLKIKALENHWNWDTEFLLNAKENKLKIRKIPIDWYSIRKSHIRIPSIFYMFRRLLSIAIRYYFSVLNKKIFRDYINEKIGIISFKIFSFLLVVFLSRILEPSGFGIYTISLSIAFLIASFSNFGVPIALVKYIKESNKKEEYTIYFRKLIKLLVIINILLLPIFYFIKEDIATIFLKDKYLSNLVIISVIISFALVLQDSFKHTFIAFERFDMIRNINFLEGLLKLIIISTLSLFLGFFGSIFGFLLAYTILIAFMIMFLKKEYDYLFKKVEKKVEIKVKELLKYLSLLNLAVIATSIYSWLDLLIISGLLDPISVAYYAITNSFIGVLLILTGLQGILLPRFASWDIETIKENLPKIFLVNFVISSIAYIFVRAFSEKLILFIYGERYLAAVDLVELGSSLLLLNSFSYFTHIFNLKGKPHYASLIIGITAIINAILDYILILNIGLIGAIWATIIAWATNILLGFAMFYKYFK